MATLEERPYVAVSIKHSEYKWKFGDPLVLWGDRGPTPDGEPRRFGGYTMYLDRAERYGLGDFQRHGYDPEIVYPVPVQLQPRFCKTWKDYDTVLIMAEDYADYCRMADIPTGPETERGWRR